MVQGERFGCWLCSPKPEYPKAKANSESRKARIFITIITLCYSVLQKQLNEICFKATAYILLTFFSDF